jgi:Helicase associated domain
MADTPIPVDEGAPETKTSVAGKRTRKLPSSSANDDDAIKSGSEDSYHQAKKPRTSKARHPRGVPWFTMLERLKQYKVKHGTFNVPRILADDQKLASWVHYQRYLFHHKTIAEERKAALDALGFVSGVEWSGVLFNHDETCCLHL